jgi:hypothetical protein
MCKHVYVCRLMYYVYRARMCMRVYIRTDICAMYIEAVYMCMCIYYVDVCLICV